ncbi:IucA/IucC family protein [Haloarcula salina]|uniref:IucA/IucC family protein n=1 Tax=Haloarcula salina TaxID=1429914 RepID=UPI003C6FFE91
MGFDDLTACERDVLPAARIYAANNDLATPPEDAYLAVLPLARRLILCRLVGGLARDCPPGVETPGLVETDGSSSIADADLPDGLDIATVVSEHPDQRILVVPIPAAGVVIVAPIATVRAFERYRFDMPVTIHHVDDVTSICTPVTIVDHLEDAEIFQSAADAGRFRSEVDESVANLGMARLAKQVQWQSVADPPTPMTVDIEGTDQTTAMDRLVTDGHPFHPGTKIRRGMDPAAGLSFAPELTGSIGIRFVAIQTGQTLEASVDGSSLTDLLLDSYPELRSAINRQIPTGELMKEYTVLPVHPWQYQRILSSRYDEARHNNTIIPVRDIERTASPLLSVRTLVPDDSETAIDSPPHLKVPLGVQLTNVVRTLSPHAISNGPAITSLLRDVFSSESITRLGVLEELAGACYHPAGGPHSEGEKYDDARNLSALARQHPRSHRLVGPESTVMTAASLLACTPCGRKSILSGVIDTFASRSETATREEIVLQFLEAYVDTVVPGTLRLLVKYGIALEAHLQNTYLVFSNGEPMGVLISDFGGIRIHKPRLETQGRELTTYPDSNITTTNPEATREKLWYTLFQNQLGELIGRLADIEPVNEENCWISVREVCERVFDQLKSDSDVPVSWVDRHRESLFDDKMVHKALTAMRLHDEDLNYCQTTVLNPLALKEGLASDE